MLLINPQRITNWIKTQRRINADRPRPKLLYDGECCFCRSSVRLLQGMDLWGKLEYAPGHKGMSEMCLEFPNGKIYGGFFAFRQLVWIIPMLYVMIPIVYFPGSRIVGPSVYRWISRHRHVLPFFRAPVNGQCPL